MLKLLELPLKSPAGPLLGVGQVFKFMDNYPLQGCLNSLERKACLEWEVRSEEPGVTENKRGQSVASFSGHSHRPASDRLQYPKMEGQDLVHFITWMTSVSTQVDTDIIHVMKYTCTFPLCFCIMQAIKNWTVGSPGNEVNKPDERLQCVVECLPRVDTDVIHVIKWTRPPPSVFAYWKQSTVRRPGYEVNQSDKKVTVCKL